MTAEFKVVIATCYGAANTGQLAGAVATELAKENEDYHLVCLPAVAIDKDTGLNKIAGAELFVIIEGCPVMCCSKIVEEHSGRKPDIRAEMVGDYGVKKAPVLDYDEAEKERIKADAKRRIEEALAGSREWRPAGISKPSGTALRRFGKLHAGEPKRAMINHYLYKCRFMIISQRKDLGNRKSRSRDGLAISSN